MPMLLKVECIVNSFLTLNRIHTSELEKQRIQNTISCGQRINSSLTNTSRVYPVICYKRKWELHFWLVKIYFRNGNKTNYLRLEIFEKRVSNFEGKKNNKTKIFITSINSILFTLLKEIKKISK